MSKAFVTGNESWEYCIKAGERCVMAEQGRECRDKDCEYATKTESLTDEKQGSDSQDK